MTVDTSWGSQGLPGFAAARTYTQLGRDFAALWATTSERMVCLSVETNESAMEALRASFGPAVVPGVSEVWNWWASAAAGLFGAYAETLQMGARPAPELTNGAEAPATEIEIDVTEPAMAEVRAPKRAAAAEARPPRVTAPTNRRRRSAAVKTA
jgi:hypothetical protein